jgi:dTDP-4-dehydrorhamnose reductase
VKVLVTGGGGRLGRALVRRAAEHALVAFDRAALDITDGDAVSRAIELHWPNVVINAAGYTAVDRAETDSGAAFAVNAVGAGHVARACADRSIAFVHVSTDHVFDGEATRPYREDDAVAPCNVYGQSKADGERAVLEQGGTVVRTSWLFGDGTSGFVPTIAARLRAGETVEVVDDQHGCPTWADDLADALLTLAALRVGPGVYHYCGEGPTTWHGFAVAIAEVLGVDPSRIAAISSAKRAAPARRPAYAVLDTARMRSLGIEPKPWRRGLLTILSTTTV